MTGPLRAFMQVKRRELPLAILMFTYFFLVITSFWILKPIKKTIFITFYDISGFEIFGAVLRASQAELLAKILNMVVAFVAVVVFTWLSHRFRRQQLTYIFSVFFILSYIAYSFGLRTPGAGTVWSFYLFGDLFSTLMVATFFAFINDSVSPDAAKRLYGLIGLGGVAGGVFGTSVLRVWVESVDPFQWMWVCSALALAIILIAYTAGRWVLLHEDAPSIPHDQPQRSEPPENKHVASRSNPAFEGARLVFSSKYLLSIVGIVGVYEIVSTTLDFQFTETISHYLDGEAIGRHFATVYTITNWSSMLVQFFLTSFIMTRFGLTIALAILPAAMFMGSTAFMIVPALWVGSMLNTADNAFSYSINQSAKETLYVPTSREEKYKAKAFIDMFVQRFAKALAVGVSLLITTLFRDFESLRWLSIFPVSIILVWIVAVRVAGRGFALKAGGNASQMKDSA
ncbi:MFS transporter [bacterium]|nr:MFS transporter [bacterium]